MGSSPALRWAPPTFEEHRNEIILNENQPKGPLLQIIEEAEPEGGGRYIQKNIDLPRGQWSVIRGTLQYSPPFLSAEAKPAGVRVSNAEATHEASPEIQGQFSRMSIFFKLKLF